TPGIAAGAWVKALTLKMLRAERLRGIAQWANPSVRVHTRMGPLRLLGRVPGAHERKSQSFVYECDVRDEARVGAAMQRQFSQSPTRRIHKDNLAALDALLGRAEAGEVVTLVPPGLDVNGDLLIHEAC